MECPKCSSYNREGAKFCAGCGSILEIFCSKCGNVSPGGSKFCDECGHNLVPRSESSPKEPSFKEKLEKIQRYLPKGLSEKILAQKDKIEGQVRQVTVMFCDMRGFTLLADQLGPEETFFLMDKFYEILIHKVYDYEGTVNELRGDGILALFGAPIALEDAPQRAIRSALAIHRAMASFNEKLKAPGKMPTVLLRIGINTGPVVVGTVGNDLRVQFTVVGDTINMAARMEALAEPGTTYVTGETFKLTEGFFRFEALGEKKVKGKKGLINVYRVISPSTRRTRFDVSAERGLTPFVGRRRELELLLDGFERSKTGRGQALSIVSEAGVGKSRLLYEFRKAVANEDVTFIEGKSLSYRRNVAYHTVVDILKANFDIHVNDRDSQIRGKVKKGLRLLGVDEASTLPYILELLSVKDSGIDKIPMSPESRKGQIIEALTRIVMKGAELRPLILAIEDLHWSDKNSEDISKFLLEAIAQARVLLLFTYRPEFVHTWGGKSYHSQVNLNRLSNRESLAMVTFLLGTDEIDTDLEALILDKTEGIPFFIEEFVKSLKDLKIIERKGHKFFLTKGIQEMTIPSTIQDVIMARVDSLPEDAKKVLQAGSAIEREFSHVLIKHVTGFPEKKLLSHLSVLKDSALIYERGIYPETSYIFKHALTQKVIYDSILTKRKKEFHEKIGNAIAEVYKDKIDGQYVILAEHYINSENFEKGCEYAELASKRFEKSASLNYAIAYAKKSVKCLEKLPMTDINHRKIIDARTNLGLYFNQMGYFAEAKRAVDSIVNLASELGFARRLAQVHTIIGTYNYWVEEDLPSAFKHLEQSLKISEEVNDFVSLVLTYWGLGVASAYNCEYEKAHHYIQKAIEINTASKSLWGISLMKSSLSLYGYNFQGLVNKGYQTSAEALKIAEKSGDIYSKATAYTGHGCSYLLKGFLKDAVSHLLTGLDFGQKIDFLFSNITAHNTLGEAYCELGEYQKSKDHYCKAISFLENSKISPSWINLIKISLMSVKIMNNEKDIDLSSMYGFAASNKVKRYDGLIHKLIAEILLNIDDRHTSEAEDWIKKAITVDKRNGAMWHLGRDYALCANILKQKGEQSKSKENLAKAIDIFKDCGANGWAEKNEKELASLS